MWHETAKKSMWDGSITALCGHKSKAGEYTDGIWVIPETGPRCPECRAIKKARKRGK